MVMGDRFLETRHCGEVVRGKHVKKMPCLHDASGAVLVLRVFEDVPEDI
jgi:hypothetical protein